MGQFLLTDYEQSIRRTFNRLGLDLHRYRPEQSAIGRLSRMLFTQGVDVVFDVGANVGQFAMALRHAGYQKKIISFEPLTGAHKKLLAQSQRDDDWLIAPRCAVGDRDGEIIIHISENQVSSSALNMLESHVAAAPASAYIGNETAPLCTLDSLSSNYLQAGVIPFLKIDTQGYEQHVLDGAATLLQQVKGVQLELSLVPLYEGQQLLHAFVERFVRAGFSIWSIEPGFCDPKTGRMLQVDVTFFRD